jgi:hypothetical protein
LKLRRALAAFALLAGSAATAAAQGPSQAVRWPRLGSYPAQGPQSLFNARLTKADRRVAQPTPAVDSASIPPTHWKAGALIGGGFLGLLGAVAGVQLSCYDGPCHNRLLGAVGGFAFGGLVGFGIGALIGGQFPARTP